MEYIVPTTLKEAETLKRKLKKSAYLAGGTGLNWRGAPKVDAVIDLQMLPLKNITVNSRKISIGALATVQEVAQNRKLPASLRQAAQWFTSINIRNIATVGGSATGNFPVSNLLPVLLAYCAEIEYFSSGSKKRLPLEKWLKTKPGIICAVVIKKVKRTVTVMQDKISALDFPLVVTALGYSQAGSKIKDPVVAISGAAAHVAVSQHAAKYLAGRTVEDIDAETLDTAVQKDLKPIKNVKASIRVKRNIVTSHLKNMLA